jgi:cardiolipin synthase
VSHIPEYLPYLLGALYLLLEIAAIIAAVEALLGTRPSQSAIAWSLFLVMFPLFGLPLYLMFGGRKFSGYISARRSGNEPLQRMVREISAELPTRALARFTHEEGDHRVLTRLASMPFFAGNDSRLLIDGEATFDAIFAAIDSAREYILVQFFIVKNDDLGYELQERLIGKARQNVRVYFIYDSVGSNALSRSYLRELQQAGVKTMAFGGGGWSGGHPFRVNFRNHRKIVVVDGIIAFVGGHNVGNEYLGKSDNPKLRPWRDTHVSIEGPAVLAVQLAFIEDWYWMTRQIPKVRTEPVFAEQANQRILVLPSGPADKLDTCGLLFTELIHSARERIWIVSPYFVPDDPVISALQLAALRGVDVRIMLPEKADHLLVYLAKFSYLEETLSCGIKFFNYQRGFLHNKVVLVDRQIAGVGTANLDNRSFRLNFEITLLFVERKCVDDVEQMLLRDFEHCREMTIQDIERRPFWFKLATRIARLFSPIL